MKDPFAKNNKIRIIDIRRKADFGNSPTTIAGAVRQDSEKAAECGNTLAKDEDLVVYCLRGGSLSQGFTAILEVLI
jgi:rhodanese-related sulfurtransferase